MNWWTVAKPTITDFYPLLKLHGWLSIAVIEVLALVQLVDYAIALIRDRIAENVGCRFVVTDAKSEAVSFYEKQGFVLLDSEGNQSDGYRLMFLDLTTV